MRYDFIIAGSGIAGLYAALLAKEHGSVLVLTKGSIDESNTRYAQGGIAAAVGPDDSPDLHLDDTVEAGAGLVDEQAARVLVNEARDRIGDLSRFGVEFDSLAGQAALGREGAHSRARILHAGGDSTGARMELSLSSLARQSGITIREHCFVGAVVVGEGRACGVTAIDTTSGTFGEFQGRTVILATGGCGRLYRVTTNPAVATGDGVAAAYRAGAEVQDMEFVQFHPTALHLAGAPPFLISEAVRGEGAVLRTVDGQRFLHTYDPRAELAPRDVVARAIHSEMEQSGETHVLLDMTHLPPEQTVARFPQIHKTCLKHGIDITTDQIPVSPAAHYMMGGVRTNAWGETTIGNLYACGECACTGVHGANRLASNSLLETVVFAKRVIERIVDGCSAATARSDHAMPLPETSRAETPPVTRDSLQSLMWERAGIVRDETGLEQARAVLSAWQAQLDNADPADRELANLTLCGRLVAEAARAREESRGAHYRRDFPESRDEWRRHIVFRNDA